MKYFKKISILMIATTTKRMTTKRIRKIYSHLKERRTTSEEFFQLERTQYLFDLISRNDDRGTLPKSIEARGICEHHSQRFVRSPAYQ